MHNVDRLEEPRVLKRNARRWTDALLCAIAEAERTNGQVKSSLWNRYNHKEVRECLKKMFLGLCCYCESRIGDVAHENIEHRKPKSKSLFPELTFSWHNLHLACPNCNQAKGDKWDTVNEILDAVNDNPIPDHLTYEFTRTAVLRHAVSNRGAVTIDHADLNRETLLDPRQEVFNDAWKTVSVVRDRERQEGDTPRVRTAKKGLRRLFSGELGSLIEYVAKTVLDTV
jgi:uncharacterized protein (TIGR02646 family)